MKLILFQFIFGLLLLSGSSLSSNSGVLGVSNAINSKVNEQEHVVRSLTSEEDFILQLIQSGELDIEKGISSKSGKIDHDISQKFVITEQKYTYNPEKYREDAISAYTNYGIAEVDTLNKPADSSNLLVINYEPFKPDLSTFESGSYFIKEKLNKLEREFFQEELKNQKEYIWDNSVLGFDENNEKSWYRLSCPIFSEDSSKVLIQISELCTGLCGFSIVKLYCKDAQGKWESETLMSWWY